MIRRTIDTERFSEQLRLKGVRAAEKKVLITNFAGSQQSRDFTVPPNCAGFGRVHHFHRGQPYPWPENSLPIDPAAKALKLGRLDGIETQVFQSAICSWRCWYCFVDFKLLSADTRFAEFKTADELLDLYMAEKPRPMVIDLSGGQPDLIPEWSYWFMEALTRRGLENSVYVWSDDNLSNDYLWRYLDPTQVARLAAFPNYGRVGCFKGFDERSFAFNTKAAPQLFHQQFVLMRRLIDAHFDVYGYVTFTVPDDTDMNIRMAEFVDRLQEEVHPLFPLRTVPLRIQAFTPTTGRLGPEESRAFHVQEQAVIAWAEELRRRFGHEELQKDITAHSLE